MKRLYLVLFSAVLFFASTVSGPCAAEDMAKKLNDMLLQGPAYKFWQISADEVMAMINEGRTDFLVVDVRPNPIEYNQGHIPGAIQIPVESILKPENLRILPKHKMLILVGVTGQTQNLPIIALRALGYDAYTMKFGMSSWIEEYYGGKIIQGAVQGAAEKNYPLEK